MILVCGEDITATQIKVRELFLGSQIQDAMGRMIDPFLTELIKVIKDILVEEKKEKPKKKKVSLSAQVRKLKKEIKRLDDLRWENWKSRQKISDELDTFYNFFPTNFYQIKYKIKANNDQIIEYVNIVEGFTIKHAIFKLKENKTHPKTFELIEFKNLGH